MAFPVQITFRDIDSSDAVKARIEERAEKLSRLHERITGVHAVVDAPHRRGRKGRLYRVQIDVTLPGAEVVVTRDRHDRHEHEDVFVAIRDAFDALERRLEAKHRMAAGEIKMHEVPPHGRIARLFRDYGFIDVGPAGELYFHRNAVADGRFEELSEGAEVRFTLAPDDSAFGPQASTVHPVGKRHVNEPEGL